MIKVGLLKRRMLLALPLLAVGGFITYEYLHDEKAMVKSIDLKMLEPFSNFFTHNDIDPRHFLYGYDGQPHTGDWPGFLFHNDSLNHGLNTQYDIRLENGVPFQLPLVGQLIINIRSGYVVGYIIDLPANLITLEDAINIANQLSSQFKQAGYAQIYSPKQQATAQKISDDDGFYDAIWQYPIAGRIFNGFFRVIIAIEKISAEKSDYLRSSIDYVRVGNEDAAEGYFIRLTASIDHIVADELRQLERLRRLAMTGDRTKALSLQDWYDNPYWRPIHWNGNFV